MRYKASRILALTYGRIQVKGLTALRWKSGRCFVLERKICVLMEMQIIMMIREILWSKPGSLMHPKYIFTGIVTKENFVLLFKHLQQFSCSWTSHEATHSISIRRALRNQFINLLDTIIHKTGQPENTLSFVHMTLRPQILLFSAVINQSRCLITSLSPKSFDKPGHRVNRSKSTSTACNCT